MPMLRTIVSPLAQRSMLFHGDFVGVGGNAGLPW
jgi:hypothetical protein